MSAQAKNRSNIPSEISVVGFDNPPSSFWYAGQEYKIEGGKTMKKIEIKEGIKTIIKFVPDDYEEEKHDVGQRDLTTGGASLIAMNMTEEEYERIFCKKKNG